MKLSNGEEIRFTDRHRRKYDSAMAEYLCTVEGGTIVADEDTGTVEAPTGWVGRFGRRLMTEDDRGFITVERFATEAEAVERFEEVTEAFNVWDSQDEALHLSMTIEALGTGTMTGTKPTIMNRYNVTFTDQNGDTLTVPFYTGLGWDRLPSIGDVLQCLASDLSVDTPEEAEDLGLGIRGWLQMDDQNRRVQAFFGNRVDGLMQFAADERYAEAATGTEVTL
jgi:hypothetical protein